MRDNHDGMPEILDAYERAGQFYGPVRIVVEDQPATFEFGLCSVGHVAVKRIRNTRPFRVMPGIRYRYFFSGGYGRLQSKIETFTFTVRIEEAESAKEFEFTGPKLLLSNLLWFTQLKSLEATAHLKRLDGAY